MSCRGPIEEMMREERIHTLPPPPPETVGDETSSSARILQCDPEFFEDGPQFSRRAPTIEEDAEVSEDGDIFLPIPSCAARGASHDTDKSQARTPEPVSELDELFMIGSQMQGAAPDPTFEVPSPPGLRQTRAGSCDKRLFPHVKILSDYSAGLRNSPLTPPPVCLSPKLRQDAICQSCMLDPAEVSLGELLCEDEAGSVHEGRWRGGAVSVRVLKHKAGVDMTHDECRELLRDLVRPMRHPGLVLHMGSCRPISESGNLMLLSEPLTQHKRLASWITKGDGSSLTAAKIAKDVLQALCFLHQSSPPIVLGRLDADRLVVDPEGHVKIPDVEVEVALKRRGLSLGQDNRGASVYRAPEGASGLPSSNVYSTGVVVLSVLLRRTPKQSDIEKILKFSSSSSSLKSSSWYSPLRSKSKSASFSMDAASEPGSPLKKSESVPRLPSFRKWSSSPSVSPPSTAATSPRATCKSVKSIVADMLATNPTSRPTAIECMHMFEDARKQLQESSTDKRNMSSCSIM